MNRKAKYITAILLCVLIGLSSRYTSFYPQAIQVHLGDAVWASMIYFGFKLITKKDNILSPIFLSLFFCLFIEFSQIYQGDWLVHIRNTFIGGLILGKGFLWMDLLRYAIGIVLAVAADMLLFHKKAA
jgi:hypothetical protein